MNSLNEKERNNLQTWWQMWVGRMAEIYPASCYIHCYAASQWDLSFHCQPLQEMRGLISIAIAEADLKNEDEVKVLIRKWQTLHGHLIVKCRYNSKLVFNFFSCESCSCSISYNLALCFCLKWPLVKFPFMCILMSVPSTFLSKSRM